MRMTIAAILLMAALVWPTSAPAQSGPKLVFYQTGLLEMYCGQVSAVKPDPAAVAEIRARLPEFKAAWSAEGPALTSAVERLTGRPFLFRETAVVLHACPDMPSWSVPMTIAAARYTKAAGGAAESGLVRRALQEGKSLPKLPPRPMSDFVYTVWHELMHRYVRELEQQSAMESMPIQAKYASENATVRDHIVLFAIEKLVWHRAGRKAEYDARSEQTRQKGYTNYVRAREIVEREGAERIVSQLRPHP